MKMISVVTMFGVQNIKSVYKVNKQSVSVELQ